VLLNGYTLAGAEALSRWFHQGQVMPPNSFVPILEQSQAVCRLDFYVLEHVCRDIRKWMEEGRQVVKVSVNLSRRHLGNRRLLEQILEIIYRYEVPHKYIEIELTETTTDVDFTDLKKIVTGLHEAGISTAVDDFGMGYSSMNLLRTLPWDVLKIDKNFLPADGKAEKKDYIMLKYLIAMSQDMGLECIVEGVETVEQIKILKENNCFLAQGYYFDKPLPKKEFESRMK
jgi:EAL domain-containing protein (putative c-di-GMP-specific phosphodiesterase class I)